MRQPLAEKAGKARRDRLGSQETSLRSLHHTLEERGQRMRSPSILRAAALSAALATLAALPATATATSSQAEVDAAIEAAVAYVRAQQKPELPGEPELGAIPGFG